MKAVNVARVHSGTPGVPPTCSADFASRAGHTGRSMAVSRFPRESMIPTLNANEAAQVLMKRAKE